MTVTGSFTFDPDMTAISNTVFISTNGTSFAGADYLAVDPDFTPSAAPSFLHSISDHRLADLFLQLDNPLTDAGGAQHFTDAEYVCQNANCSFLDPIRTGDGYITTLSVGTAATPEPSSGILLATGLASAALTCFRPKNRTKEL